MAFPLNVPRRNESGPRELTPVMKDFEQFGARARNYVDAAGLWCTLGYSALAFQARQPGGPDLAGFFGLIAWTALPAFALYWYFRNHHEPLPVGRMFFWAAIFRICGLVGGPFFEDDFYRYLWDGFRFATTGSPYGAAPEEFFVDPSVPAAFQNVLDRINNPDLPTIYAPLTEVLFLVGYWLKPGSILALQSILVVVDLLTIGLLLRLAPARGVMLYAWCPLIVKEIAFTAHPDGLGVGLLLAAILLARGRRWQSAAVCLGLAVASKAFALVLAPLVLVNARAKHWIVACTTTALIYAPFVIAGATDVESLRVFAREWEFNSAAFGLLKSVMRPLDAKLALGLIFAVFWAHYAVRLVKRGVDEIPRGDWVYGVLLAVSPVINPWYLIWLLPFAAIFPSAWAWTASALILLSYVSGTNLGDYGLQPYQQPVWVRVLEFGLILVALAYDVVRHRLSIPKGRVAG